MFLESADPQHGVMARTQSIAPRRRRVLAGPLPSPGPALTSSGPEPARRGTAGARQSLAPSAGSSVSSRAVPPPPGNDCAAIQPDSLAHEAPRRECVLSGCRGILRSRYTESVAPSPSPFIQHGMTMPPWLTKERGARLRPTTSRAPVRRRHDEIACAIRRRVSARTDARTTAPRTSGSRSPRASRPPIESSMCGREAAPCAL